MSATLAKDVIILGLSFRNVAQDCAPSFSRRQLLKGDGLHKNGRLDALFGVAAEALSGSRAPLGASCL